MRVLFAIVAAMIAVPVRAAPSIESAERALHELRWEAARRELEALTTAGHHDRAALIRILQSRARLAAMVDGPDAAEREYRRLLALSPDEPAPRDSPVFAEPFARARKWIEQNGGLRIALDSNGADRTVRARVVGDPLAMVAGMRLHVRSADGFAPLPARPLTQTLPATDGPLDYFVEIVDDHEDELAHFGDAAEPLHFDAIVRPTPAPVAPIERRTVKRHRLRGVAIGVGALALASLATGGALDGAANAEFADLDRQCAPSCQPPQLATLHTEENAAVAFYAVGGAAAVASIVLFVIDHYR